MSGEPVRHPGGQRAQRSNERAQHAVARKDRGARLAVGGMRQSRMLQWQEDAHVTGARVQGADERDQQQRPIG